MEISGRILDGIQDTLFSPVHLLPEINYIFLSFMPKLSKKDLK